MHINSISITGFRNFKSQEIKFSSGVNVLHGNNGSGKTNLLESIFVLCLGRSHRSSTDSVMIEKNMDYYRLEGEIFSEKNYEVAIAFQTGSRKKITLDGVSTRIQELYDIFSVVSLGPEDSEILSGAPSVRRTFMDLYLSQKSKNYLDHLTKYQKVLAQKNAALKKEIDHSAYNTLMAQHGAEIMLHRIKFLNQISEISSKSYSEITNGGKFELKYKPSITLDSNTENIEDIFNSYQSTLDDVYERERIMMSSLYGIHRDDILFEIEGFPARHHGSQGEWRTSAISLKLAVYHILKEQHDTSPILLLDEIFAELDNNRIGGLINIFGDFGQLFLTTAQKPPEIFLKDCKQFKIADGQVVGEV